MGVEGKKKRILFIDDDEKLLQGLKRGLRTKREEWELFFIDDAEDALALMAEDPVDVVVSDVKMPKMDGFTLLRSVKKCYPQTMRVILSGETGEQIGYQALEVANQCLVKPCAVDELTLILTDMLACQSALGGGIVEKAINRLDALPSIPQRYWELKKVIDDPDSAMGDIAKVMEKDMSMAAKVLQLANSAFFGFSSERVTNLVRAITMLGLDVVGQLALVNHVFSEYDDKRCPNFSIDDLWTHSLKVSQLARTIAVEERLSSSVIETAMLGGLLHEFGKLVFASALSREYDHFLSVIKNRPGLCLKQELSLERRTFGTTHLDVGAYMVGVWGLPHEIVTCIANYLRPIRCVMGLEKGHTALSVVCGAILIEDGMVQHELGKQFINLLGKKGDPGALGRWEKIAEKLRS